MFERTSMSTLLFIFFFQAEDGIRDYKVTGVQTCALPICFDEGVDAAVRRGDGQADAAPFAFGQSLFLELLPVVAVVGGDVQAAARAAAGRSEERRVGKECRSRWSPYH